MTITPLNAAGAVFLDAQAKKGTAEAPVTGVANKELDRLLMYQVEHGSIPAAEYRKTCKKLRLSKRQVQRKLAALRRTRATTEPPGRRGFTLTEHHRQVIFACAGNVALAHSQLVAAGEPMPHYKVFWRAWHALPTGVQAYARKGAEALVEFWLYPPHEAPHRNAVWQGDHFELPVDVIADGHTSALVKPWLTIFEDDATRRAMAWALTASPGRRADADVVCATIAAAIRIRLEGGVEVGGIPGAVRWDNDLSFNAGMVLQLGMAVGFECHSVPPYSGHMKGKVERLGRTVQEEFCVLQPGYTHGPKTYRRKDPFRNATPLTAAQLRSRLEVWFAEYNLRRHSSLERSPHDAWVADTTPLRKAADPDLRTALLVDPKLHKVHPRKGVFFGGWWQAGPLMDVIGRRVEIRYPVGDRSFIEVYHDGRWLCTAWPAKALTEKQRKDIFAARDEMYSEVRATHERAAAIRAGANAATGTTDATPSVASMPAVDPLAASTDDLYDLIERATGTDGTGGEAPQETEA